jgi:hypothetical protein
MQAETEVSGGVQERFGGVQAHPNSKLRAFRPLDDCELPLRVHGGGHGVCSAVEGSEVRIALRVDQVAFVGAARVLDQAAVLGSNVPVSTTEGAHELRRAFDVGEQERDSAARKVSALAARRSVRQESRA